MKRTRIFFYLVVASFGAGLFPGAECYGQGDLSEKVLASNSSTIPAPQPQPTSLMPPNIVWIGASGGVDFVSYRTSSFSVISSEPSCFTAQNGKGINPLTGISIMEEIGGAGNHNFVIVELSYDSKSSTFNSTGTNSDGFPTKINGIVQPGGIIVGMKAALSYLTVALEYKHNFIEWPMPHGPNVQFGLNLGMRMLHSFTKTVTVSAGTSNAGQKSSAQEVVEAIDGASLFRFGLRGRLAYDVPIARSLYFSPFVGYDLPFTKVDNTDRAWTASSVFAGVGLHYSIELGY